MRLRSYIFQGFFQKDASQVPPFLAPSPGGSASNLEAASSNNTTPRENYSGNDPTTASNQNLQTLTLKVTKIGPCFFFITHSDILSIHDLMGKKAEYWWI